MTSTAHTHNSSYREILLEHLLVGQIMQRLWVRGISEFEVLRPQVDDSGYDLVIEANGVVRHVQLKTSFRGATTAQVKASLKLLAKPSACVLWVQFDRETLELGPFLWFGGKPGEPMTDIRKMRTARHSRANAKGVKQERPNQRTIPKARFERVNDLEELLLRMFGEFRSRVGQG